MGHRGPPCQGALLQGRTVLALSESLRTSVNAPLWSSSIARCKRELSGQDALALGALSPRTHGGNREVSGHRSGTSSPSRAPVDGVPGIGAYISVAIGSRRVQRFHRPWICAHRRQRGDGRLPDRSQSHPEDRPRRGAARRRRRRRGRTRSRRPHARASLGRGGESDHNRARRAGARGPQRNRRALAGDLRLEIVEGERAAKSQRRPSSTRPRPCRSASSPICRTTSRPRSSPAGSRPNPGRRSMNGSHSCSSARSPAHRRHSGRARRLWAPRGAGRMADGGAHPVRRPACRLRSGAEGHVERGRAHSARRACAV